MLFFQQVCSASCWGPRHIDTALSCTSYLHSDAGRGREEQLPQLVRTCHSPLDVQSREHGCTFAYVHACPHANICHAFECHIMLHQRHISSFLSCHVICVHAAHCILCTALYAVYGRIHILMPLEAALCAATYAADRVRRHHQNVGGLPNPDKGMTRHRHGPRLIVVRFFLPGFDLFQSTMECLSHSRGALYKITSKRR